MERIPRRTHYESVVSAATAHGLKTFLVTAYGEPYMDGGFGNRMRVWCNQAELRQCTVHGLKKAAATI